jgi:hypothetical protein
VHRGRVFTVFSVAVIVGGLIGAWLIPAASQVPDEVHIEAITKFKTEKDTFLDLGETGLSIGDRFIQKAPLFDEANRDDKIGASALELLILKRNGELSMGNWSFELPDGQICAAGKLRVPALRSDTGAEVAISGGTGAYAHASGILTIRSEDENEGSTGRHFYIFEIAATVDPV